jgi:hypothetical protein
MTLFYSYHLLIPTSISYCLNFQAIALARGFQVATILGHLLDAWRAGLPVDIGALAQAAGAGAGAGGGDGPPSRQEWEVLQMATQEGTVTERMVVLASVPAVLKAEGGELVADWNDLSPRQKALRSYWSTKLKWMQTMREVGFAPTFLAPSSSSSPSSSPTTMHHNTNDATAAATTAAAAHASPTMGAGAGRGGGKHVVGHEGRDDRKFAPY